MPDIRDYVNTVAIMPGCYKNRHVIMVLERKGADFNAPDCEEIVLMVFPLYCLITPLLGGLAAYFLYRRQSGQE